MFSIKLFYLAVSLFRFKRPDSGFLVRFVFIGRIDTDEFYVLRFCLFRKLLLPEIKFFRMFDEEEIRTGLYIPTMEKLFKNTPEGDIARAKFTLEDWLRQKNRKHKTDN